jgi:purine-binding chemotaxis protein CheW
VCALPLTYVIETMRQLPIEPITGVPCFVLGVSIIRGIATPVVDLGVVLAARQCNGERVVTVRLGERQVALSVDAVLGVRELDSSTVSEMPPLLKGASRGSIETLGTLDEQLLMVLCASWELPDEVWQIPTAQEVAS